MYNVIFYIFEIGVFVASFFNEKVRKMWKGERASFRYLKEHVDPNADYAWFHAASLGEFEQGRPIMEEFRKVYPEKKILLTFFSPSGYEVRKNYELADLVCYLPIDTPTNAIRFLRTVRPSVAFFIKYEFWYNYMHILRHRGVPVYSVSSIFRSDQVFFRWYGKTYAHVLKCFTHFFVQNEESKRLLASIGITNVDVTGDTRFDRVATIASQSKNIPAVATFVKNNPQKVFVAGSSWLPDEQIFLPYLAQHPEWKIIIAPHVIAENHIEMIMQLLKGRRVMRYSQLQVGDHAKLAEAEVLIIDCFGLLSSIYKYGTVAYVGGGFGVSIHNLPEAAVWNIPVIFGPNNHKFQEAQELKACQGGFEITSAEDFALIMNRFSADKQALKAASDAAGNYVRSQSGATERLLQLLRESKKE
ncbi:MAG: 3-deoxy-D-manno-octulosonic acid transferase [Prevotella sp.]|nr:3-deoxy-D-manno-octulosonic acid transferase [Prevotella sp.]